MNKLTPSLDITPNETHYTSSLYLDYFYGLSGIPDKQLDSFQSISDSLGLINHYKSLVQGAVKNPSENRSVLHHSTRLKETNFYTSEQQKANAFASDVHNGKITGFSQKKFTDVVQFGIGGSVLGPKALFHGMCDFFSTQKKPLVLHGHFISHLDPSEFHHKFSSLNPETTLFIIASKSGNSQETITNLELLKSWWTQKGLNLKDLKYHCVSVTTKASDIDSPLISQHTFYMDRSIGGRFSSTSVMGGVLLSLCFGPEMFKRLLAGAADQDLNAYQKKVTQNISLLSAFIASSYVRDYHFNTKAIIPYSYALSKFPDHLQQLLCESNGKNTHIDGTAISHKTSPIVFGDSGTNAQHSFFQLIHQGTDIVPVEFIGFKHSTNTSKEYIDAHKKLKSNLISQQIAMAVGDSSSHFYGGRPSTLIILSDISPESLGSLLAYYENMTLFQGFIFNINSFDQPGVELGKKINLSILDETHSENYTQHLKNYLAF